MGNEVEINGGPTLPSKQPKIDAPEVSNNKKLPGTHVILVSKKQRGNPVLKLIKNVTWEYDDEILPDYVFSPKICALYLSLKYHQLHPDYIHERLKSLGSAFQLRVLLVMVDVREPDHSLKHLTRICILADLTLMLAWNSEDAAKIIETYKLYETKPPDLIMERTDTIPQQKLINALTSVRSVNKTDAMTLLSTFGTLAGILKATPTSLSLCPGFGIQKAQRLHKILHDKFLHRNSGLAK